jgi:hypothetical protein
MMAKALACLVAGVAVFASSSVAQAGTRVVAHWVMGHKVRMVKWRPATGVRALVGFSLQHQTVPGWAKARHRTRIVAAINGGTWDWRSGRPIGTVSHGRMVTRVQNRPAVGFLASGAVIFGAKPASKHHAGNIISGVAYLVRNGTPVRTKRDAPWASVGQWSCGPPGTDGNGCWRSNVVRLRDGSVGLVEIAYASMPTAARILRRLGATDALTLDSGGSADLWTRVGRRGTCANPHVFGHCFGITHAVGLHWERITDRVPRDGRHPMRRPIVWRFAPSGRSGGVPPKVGGGRLSDASGDPVSQAINRVIDGIQTIKGWTL